MMGQERVLGSKSGRGLALLCDAEGTICQVLRNDFARDDIARDVSRHNELDQLAPGRPLSLIVDRASMPKALDLLVDLRAKGTTIGWKLNVPAGERVITLQFSGIALEEQLPPRSAGVQ